MKYLYKPYSINYAAYGRWIDHFTYEGGSRHDQCEEQRRIEADLAHKAEVQHRLFLGGDPRGMFGDYPPVIEWGSP